MNSGFQETAQTTVVTGNNQQNLEVNSEGSSNTDNQTIPNSHLIEENPDQLGVQNSYGSRGETIGLKAGSFGRDKQEELEIFLEKCEFVLACAHDHIQVRFLQGIQVRLTGKARQAVKFKDIKNWAELKDV